MDKSKKMKLIKITVTLFVSAITLNGCAGIDPIPFSGPNGRQAYSMKCSGLGRTLDMCYQKAGQLCSAGYSIVHSTTGTVVFDDIIKTKNTIAIECK